MTAFGQPDLFTKRVRKPPPAPERSLHIAVADMLRRFLSPGWVAFHPANGEHRTEATGALLKRMLVLPGVSDFILLGPGPIVCALELKKQGNTPSHEQKAFLAAVRAIGGHAEWTHSYNQAISILAEWGALRIKVSA